MSFDFQEAKESGHTTDDPPTLEKIYVCTGLFDEGDVLAAARALTPLMFIHPRGNIFRKDIDCQPVGYRLWRVTVPYEKREKKNTPVGEFTFSFDTTGATVNIKAAKEHVKSYPTDGTWHKGAIGVKADGDVEGVEIVIPALKITYSFKHEEGYVDEAFAKKIANATGHTNNDTFREFEADELLFVGGTGSDGNLAEATVDYQFIASGNATGLKIGSIVDIAKKGHDALWIEFKDEVASGEAVRQPKRVHIERVYDSINFAETFGFS